MIGRSIKSTSIPKGPLALAAVVLMILPVACFAADHAAQAEAVQVELNTAKTGPRAVESLTEKAITRDYRTAWSGLAHALEFNTADPLAGVFSGEAKAWLEQSVAQQQTSKISRLYSNQRHRLEAVFYAPEGDVMELHDTASYDEQILNGGKAIAQKQVAIHYVVLMTPGADRWVIRQLQAVPQF